MSTQEERTHLFITGQYFEVPVLSIHMKSAWKNITKIINFMKKIEGEARRSGQGIGY